jgi:mRNA interferase RelE/StbE
VYEVYLERSAENDKKRLPTSTFDRIVSQIKTLAENPRPSGCRKLTASKNDWRIRMGIVVSFTRLMREQRP